MEPDFSGYATKAGLKCSDGRTITEDAFKHQDKMTVPLVWQHGHNEPTNVLGHAVLEFRDKSHPNGAGIYTYAFFNETEHGQAAKQLVQHGDIKHLSIYANQLVEKAKAVLHGVIREVSLVLAGANPGALIDHVAVQHSDGEIETMEDEAVIFTGLELQHGGVKPDDKKDDVEPDDKKDDVEHAATDTVQEIYESMNDEQKTVLHYMVEQALEAAKDTQHSSDNPDDPAHKGSDSKENKDMTHNVFDRTDKDGKKEAGHVLTHDAMRGIFEEAQQIGSLNKAVENYVVKHGIENIEGLFPEAKDLDGGAPTWVTRRMEWVAGVLNGVRKSPFSRIKTRTADLTHEEARARGYIKGNFKKEQWFTHTQRTTGPTTVYKKQKLDRDDILDITDFDVVAWIKAEMRVMLEEELARAILVGDGRPTEDPANPGEPNPDKIRDPEGAADGLGIRSILNENELYARKVYVELDDADTTFRSYGVGLVEQMLLAREFYRGTGLPTFYTTQRVLTRALLARDQMGRRLYRTRQELADEMQVANIVPVEVMEDHAGVIGILVNLADYVVGADRGGEVNLFDNFDIDYNQYKYLIETRCSGALTKLMSAQVFYSRPVADTTVAPTEPTFDGTVVTIPTDANYDYTVDGAPVADASTHTVAEGESVTVTAVPVAGVHPPADAETSWTFTNFTG